MEEEALLSIGVFARRARLSPKALRLYDRHGLLPPDHVDPVTGYRYYRQDRLAAARLIVRLRGLDMPLADVGAVLAAPAPEAARLVAAYWDGVERRHAAQRELAAHLRIHLLGDEGILDMYEIQQREVPEQLVLTEQRHITPEELPHWIPAALGRLLPVAQAHGGVFGPPVRRLPRGRRRGRRRPRRTLPAGRPRPRRPPPGALPHRTGPHTGLHPPDQGAGGLPADPLGLRRRPRLGAARLPHRLGSPPRGLLRRLVRDRPGRPGLRHRAPPGRLTPAPAGGAAGRRGPVTRL